MLRLLTRLIGQVMTSRFQIDGGKVSLRQCEYFGVAGCVIIPLGRLLSAVRYLTLLPLMTSGGQTAGCDGERFYMRDAHLMTHMVCYF